MAFYQNSIPMDQGHLNMVRTSAEEPCVLQSAASMAQPSGEDLLLNLLHGADPGYRVLGYLNAAPGVAAWYPSAPVPYGHMSVNPNLEHGYNPSLVTTVGGSALDQVGNGAVPSFGQATYVGNRISGIAMNQVRSENVNRSGSGGNLVGRDTGNVEEQLGSDLGMPHLSNQGSGCGASWSVDSTATTGIPFGKSGPLPPSCSQEHVEQEHIPSMHDLQPPGGGVSSALPYMQGYVDPRKENENPADFMPLRPLMGFPNQHLLGTAGPFYAQTHFLEGAGTGNSHQFVSPGHTTLVPASSQMALRPTVAQPLAHPQQTQLSHDGMTRQKPVLLSVEKSQNAYRVQAPLPMVAVGYMGHQVLTPVQVIYPDGSTTAYQRFECTMCRKALPHAHSDTVVQVQTASAASHIPISSSIHHSLSPEDNIKSQPLSRDVITGALGEDVIELGNGAQPIASREMLAGDTQARHENERNASQTKKHVMGLSGNEKSQYSPLLGVSSSESVLRQHYVPAQYQPKQEVLTSKPVAVDACPIGGKTDRTCEYQVHVSAKEYSRDADPKVDNMDSAGSVDPGQLLDKKMEILHTSRHDMLTNIEQSHFPTDEQKRVEILITKVPLNLKGEVLLDASYMFPQTSQANLSGTAGQPAPEISNIHNLQPVESRNSSQPPNVSIPRPNSQSRIGVQLDPEGVYHGNPVLSGVGPASAAEQKNDASPFQPTTVLCDVGPINLNCRVEDFQDNSKLLFKNQDAQNLNPDIHFPPPIPTKILLRKETFGAKAPALDHQSGKMGPLSAEMQLKSEVQPPSKNLTDYISPEHFPSSKAEGLIKQERQNVPEGVAASALKSASPSNHDLTVSEDNDPAHEAGQEKEMKREADAEDPDSQAQRVNFVFPASDGVGQLKLIKNSDLEEVRELGSGTCGTVYHGKWKGADVSIKRINDRCFSGKPSERERMRNDLVKEAAKFSNLRHPNVLTFYGIVVDGPRGSLATVTEYMVDGSLRNALQKRERNLDKRKRLLIAMDVAFGMDYLHGENIVHFDLKSDNLLVNLKDPNRPKCKIGDLALSKVKYRTLISGDVRGTLPWMAPELLDDRHSQVSEKVDVFSFGTVMWELLTGKEPYADLLDGGIKEGIVSNTLRPPIPESCDPDWRSLMERCWSSEPPERPSFNEIAKELRTMETRIHH